MRKKIKVCQVTTIPFAIRFLLLNQIKDLQKQGYDVSVVCSPGRWVKEIEEEGVPVKTIKITRKMSPFSDLITLIKLVFYFRREKFDIVHTSMPKPGLLGAMAARMARVPIVIHSNLGFYFQKDSHWLKRKFFLLIEKTTAKCCDLVFSVAKSDINLAIKEKICPSDKIKYLGGWVDLDRFNPNRFNQEFIKRKKRELKIDNQAKVIGINARLVRDKGYYELFKAFGEVLKKFPQALLLIIGPEEPEKRDRINPDLVFKEFGIENNVLYLGERTDVDEIYPLMDVFVLPSYREGVAISVLEALAMEKPVVATNVGGIPDSVEDGKTGILIPSKNVEKLKESLIYFLSNPEWAEKLGRQGREKIKESFDEELVFNKTEKEYERLIDQKLKSGRIKVCHIASVDITLKFMLENQLRFLRSQGYEIYAVCSPGKWVEDIKKQGIKVKTITMKRKISPFSDLIAFLQLYFYFKKEKFDIIHSHTLKPDVLGQIVAKLARVPIIINTIHGFNFEENEISFKQKFFIFLQRIAAKYSDLIFSISNTVTNTAIKEKICKPELISYLGRDIDFNRFDPQRFDSEFILEKKKQLGINPDSKVIGIVARLVEDKGYYELFEAFKKVLNKFPDAVLLIIGPEEREKKDRVSPAVVREFDIEKNVLFLGERTDVDEIYPLMDIFVLPTHREGLGAVILEASAMEIPVIASNIGGCPEAVDNNKTGILVPVKDPEKLSQTIIYLMENPELRKQMGQAGREKVKREFNEKDVFERMGKEYQRLISEKL
ncbi:MAG: hypothetical protein A2V72_01910 [Candidatus Nealsonbacteria bacterium RBG_13_37_56]|uniref:Glycosyl transferase family 1 n=1 Tax=Candidatus Nealsonbacteria bacterium RBG_13_37_56 TaxID=1801661 RepID=A0A1G2DW71_9BACT|nr:MAG: hypothetical protein A2V72_01910 [Candidatus Nealsonbacteria bacterium RBG_13_37_56]